MKKGRKLLALAAALVLAVQLAPAALAHDHPTLPFENEVYVPHSHWAEGEIIQARKLDLISGAIPNKDYRDPITRKDFCYMATQFLEVAEGQFNFWDMVRQYKAQTDEDGNLPSAFADCDSPMITLAHVVGLVEGVGGGNFAPDREITRQEAAVMLARAYDLLGAERPEGHFAYNDWDQIADWANDSVGVMRELDVMKGVEDGSNFAPLDTYTIEQCIATFLRLYENAPARWVDGERVKVPVEKMFTYEQALSNLEQQQAAGKDYLGTETARTEGAGGVLIQIEQGGGTMHRTLELILVSALDGGVRWIDPGVCNYGMALGALTGSTQIQDPQFSEDGQTLTFTITLNNDFIWYMTEPPALLHEAGDYLCTVDVATGVCTAEKQ